MVVEVEKNGPVTTIINNRPEARNAGDPETTDALTQAFMDFEADKNASVAVFWGAGGTFCAGWDLKYAATLTDPEKFNKEVVQDLAMPMGSAPAPRGPLGPSRLELSKPVIAAVEGAAVAGGMELAMWCDMRVMAEDAYFGVYCRRWGIPLLDGGTVRMPRLIGEGRAMEIALTGRKVSAEESLRIGLCERVVPAGAARAEAENLARDIARFPQAAVRADRRNIIETYGLSIRDGLRMEWANGVHAHVEEGAAGAGRFASGKGRSGSYDDI
ncbi:MAG: crotonase/enoyl-CoA hydratase family protein [Rhizobiales bacterium]|nr:crotonase/enoyl-CoA hydratase family protein [Hyphomicrobiales bacterium]